jgi:hypothetical protein
MINTRPIEVLSIVKTVYGSPMRSIRISRIGHHDDAKAEQKTCSNGTRGRRRFARLQPGKMAVDSVDQLFADGVVARRADADRDFADVLATLFDVDGDSVALRVLGRHLAVDCRSIADNVRQFKIRGSLLRRGRHLVGRCRDRR